ncbi:DUF2924 domain-containing protein [Aliiruegeria lutimaris]|uniref:DUF2924 domain-containing protein n=1 Tax=Aliiruegeria lutimaris TaxID=571298 RepID=A0A1G9DMS7_9RHOB|nr:DUF2924 domain-containing protein [Aliiruegeria lutimaris]SDK65179.1 Protein of unknown function [Aliiruegeria lutimaris]
MSPRIDVAVLAGMNRPDLIATWQEVFDSAAPKRLSRAFLRRFLAFELQSRRYGGLSRQVTAALTVRPASTKRPTSPALQPGGRLLREWNGVTHVVDVGEDGFSWNGRRYRSLSAIAREITGAHWSGPRFFGLSGSAPK